MKRPHRNKLRTLECLESRLAPASTVVIPDLDGDLVRFTSSKGDLTGQITSTDATLLNQKVFSVNLTNAAFNGTTFTVSVVKAPAGDGKAIVGHINAGTNSLGTVRIAGDLGDIDAGTVGLQAIRSLAVDSFGRFGQRGDGDATSSINGDMLSLSIKRDLVDTYFRVEGDLSSIRVGGSLIGGDGGNTGAVYSAGDIGSVNIRGDVRGGLGSFSGSVGAGHDVGNIAVSGSVYGGTGPDSGHLYAGWLAPGRIDAIRIGGSLVGAAGAYSGRVGGSLSGGNANSFGTIVIGKDIVGGSGTGSGVVLAKLGTLDRLLVNGSIIGGIGQSCGGVQVDLIGGTIVILGSIFGGDSANTNSGYIYGAKHVDTIRIRGSLIGGSADTSGWIQVVGGVSLLSIRGDVRGGSGSESGSVSVFGQGIDTKIIGGAIIPGTGSGSGQVTG